MAERVVVAMSGGVDSSATAVLLQQQGYDVVGITLQLYDHGKAVCRSNACCAGKDIQDARTVAELIGIPHYVIDFESRFHEDVVLPFARSYAAGETPVPCILCNQTVKFRDLLGIARDLGGRYLATGHYVRRLEGPDGPELWRGVDPARDQSYFLYTLTRDQLDGLLFPLGGFASKAETRAIAAAAGLPVAVKPDSQDICFVPDGDYAGLVGRLAPEALRPGQIVDEAGQVLGQHQGIIHYTVGQRKGLGLGGGPPRYVLRLDAEQARVIVGPKESLGQSQVFLRDINWLGDPQQNDVRIMARIRSTRPPKPGLLHRLPDGRGVVELDQPEEGVSPGQACVFYQGDRVLGGGWICRTAWQAAG